MLQIMRSPAGGQALKEAQLRERIPSLREQRPGRRHREDPRIQRRVGRRTHGVAFTRG
jgi:hypothetical protein